MTTEKDAEGLVKLQLNLLERLKKELVNFKKDGSNRKTKIHFENRLNRVKNYSSQFAENHNLIVQSELPDTDEYYADDFYSEFQDEYDDVIAYIETAYDTHFPQPAPIPAPIPASTTAQANNNTNASPTVSSASNVSLPFKFPTYNLPIFDGVYTEWPSFYDSFKLIHEHETLPVKHKFEMLKNALTPKVQTLIGYLNITSDNYETAVQSLIDRYSNKRVLFSNYMEKFLNQANISHETADSLQTLYDVSRSCVFELQKLGIKTNESSEIFARVVPGVCHSRKLIGTQALQTRFG